MSPARRISLAVARFFFRFSLILLISLTAFFMTFSDATKIKEALSETKAYDRFVPAVIEANKKQQTADNKLFEDKEVQRIATEAFPPKKLQTETEKFINAWYAWLSGTSFQPEYVVNFTDSKQKLASDLSNYAAVRMSSLPPCRTFDPNMTLDPFTVDCQPLGINLVAERDRLQAELLQSDNFLPKVTYTANDLPKTSSGKTIPQAYAFAPFLFGMMWYIIWALLLLVLLLALSIVMLRSVRRQGWKQLGGSMLGIGVFLAISGYVFGLLIPQYTRSVQSQFAGNGTEKIMNDILLHLTISFETNFINLSLQVAAAGLLILILLKVIKPASRYDGLERVTGLVNGVRPRPRGTRESKAGQAPIVTSERSKRKTTGKKQAKKKTKSRASKEIV